MDVPAAESQLWLAERIGRGTQSVLAVYTQDEVCEVPARLFMDHWQSHFCPAGHDVAVLHPRGGWVLWPPPFADPP